MESETFKLNKIDITPIQNNLMQLMIKPPDAINFSKSSFVPTRIKTAENIYPTCSFATKGARKIAPSLRRERIDQFQEIKKNGFYLIPSQNYYLSSKKEKSGNNKDNFTKNTDRQYFKIGSFPSKWIECVNCHKWRKIPGGVSEDEIFDPFTCKFNIWNKYYSSCKINQEEHNQSVAEKNSDKFIPNEEKISIKKLEWQHQLENNESFILKTEYFPHSRRRRVNYSSRSTHSIEDVLNEPADEDYAKRRRQFYNTLTQFLGRPPEVNQLCGKPVDLYHLYMETTSRGGYDRVCDSKSWRQIFRTLPQYSESHTSASYALKKMYRRNLQDHENRQMNKS